MLEIIQSEGGFNVCECYISDVYPEGDERIGEVGSVVVTPNDASESADGIV